MKKTDFADTNPHPEPDDRGRIIETTLEKGSPAKPMRQLYNKDILKMLF